MIVSYCIRTKDLRYTYCGATKNFQRRIRQHNGAIKGGSKYCATHGPGQWQPFLKVYGFADWRECLSFEWHWKHVKKFRRGMDPSQRRWDNLQLLLQQERWAHLTVAEPRPQKKDAAAPH